MLSNHFSFDANQGKRREVNNNEEWCFEYTHIYFFSKLEDCGNQKEQTVPYSAEVEEKGHQRERTVPYSAQEEEKGQQRE